MPSSALWAVDLFGRVCTLSTAAQHWELCRDAQLEFKRVSAAAQCCWGIACDHQVYVRVSSSDVPIRRREEAYENQVGSRVGTRRACRVGWLAGSSTSQAPGQSPPALPSFCLRCEPCSILGPWFPGGPLLCPHPGSRPAPHEEGAVASAAQGGSHSSAPGGAVQVLA